MRRFVPATVVTLLVGIASIGFSEINGIEEGASGQSGSHSVSTAIVRADCDGSCDEGAPAGETDGSCADCNESIAHCSQGDCLKQPGNSCLSDKCLEDSKSQRTPDRCASCRRTEGGNQRSADAPVSGRLTGAFGGEQSAESGPPWARGRQAGRGMRRGMGQTHMGCGRVLRNAISDGKIGQRLVQSLVFGPGGDAKQGKSVFVKNCSVCHKLRNEGADIAPDLTNTPRHNPIYLLANLSNPSAVIPQEYQVYIVMTDAGKTITGLKVEENAKAITILDAQNQRTEIRRDRIEEIKVSEKSLMPENLLQSLGERQLRDLFSYLRL